MNKRKADAISTSNECIVVVTEAMNASFVVTSSEQPFLHQRSEDAATALTIKPHVVILQLGGRITTEILIVESQEQVWRDRHSMQPC
jgi:hypothetical protein